MKKLIIFLLLPYLAWADSLSVSNIQLRPSLQLGYPTTIYLTINNPNNQLDYLVGVEIVNHPHASVSINKTVIEKNIARIIHIDRLAIPPNSTVSLAPLGIYLVAQNLSPNFRDNKPIQLKFIFKNYGAIFHKIS